MVYLQVCVCGCVCVCCFVVFVSAEVVYVLVQHDKR